MRITSRCTRGAVVGEFAGQVWSGTSTQPCLNPAPHVIVKRPSQRHGDPLEQCTLNLSLSSCDSPARPDGSARARRPPQGGWRPGIKESLGNWRIVLRVLLLLQWICQAEPMPTRVACTPCSSWPEQVRGSGGYRSTHADPSLNKREVQLTTRLAITRQREHAREREMVRRDRAKKAETT